MWLMQVLQSTGAWLIDHEYEAQTLFYMGNDLKWRKTVDERDQTEQKYKSRSNNMKQVSRISFLAC